MKLKKRFAIVILSVLILLIFMYVLATKFVESMVNCSASYIDSNIKAQVNDGKICGLTQDQINDLSLNPQNYREVYIVFDIKNRTGFDLKNLKIKNSSNYLGNITILDADRSEITVPSSSYSDIDSEEFYYFIYTKKKTRQQVKSEVQNSDIYLTGTVDNIPIRFKWKIIINCRNLHATPPD